MKITFYGNGDVAWVEPEDETELHVLSIARRLEVEQPDWPLMRLLGEAHRRVIGGELLH